MEAVWVLRPFLGSTSSARPEKKGLGTSLSGKILENAPKSSNFSNISLIFVSLES